MKIALYIEDGLEQVVLTPEGDAERALLGKLHDGSRELSIVKGSFFECRGGWMRQGLNNDSTMIVLRPAKKADRPESSDFGVVYTGGQGLVANPLGEG